MRHSYLDTTLFAFLLLILLIALYGEAVGAIGFLSDDWALIQRAGLTPFWMPAEQHHYSLVINLLFKGVAQGNLSAFSIHLLAFFFHALNSFIIFFFVRDILKRKPLEAQLVAALFAISPAGLEAITWCCAAGYVLCSFWILLALYTFWKSGNSPAPLSHANLLACLQLGAFLCWDWGLVLAPGLAIQCLMSLDQSQGNSLRRLYALWPLLTIWAMLVVFKRAIGQDFGYAVNTPWQMLANFISVPLLSLLPQFTKAFYTSFAAMALSVFFFSAMLWTAGRKGCETAKALFLLFIVWQLPLVLLGYPQSRYFYLLSFPVYFIMVEFMREIACLSVAKAGKKLKILIPCLYRVLGVAMALGILFVYFTWSHERVIWWVNASEQSQSIYVQIEAAAERELKPLAVINMPDRYGPEGIIWLPYLWRCGLVYFKNEFVQVYTYDCPHAPSKGLFLPRELIAINYPEHVLYEVKHTDGGQALILQKIHDL